MPYRPYPNPSRALAQVQRHEEESGPFVPAAPIPEWRTNLARQANTILAVAAARTAPITAQLPQAFKNVMLHHESARSSPSMFIAADAAARMRRPA